MDGTRGRYGLEKDVFWQYNVTAGLVCYYSLTDSLSASFVGNLIWLYTGT